RSGERPRDSLGDLGDLGGELPTLRIARRRGDPGAVVLEPPRTPRSPRSARCSQPPAGAWLGPEPPVERSKCPRHVFTPVTAKPESPDPDRVSGVVRRTSP